MVVTVIFSGCYRNCFWLLQYSFSGGMVLIFGYCSTDFRLLLLQYSFLVVLLWYFFLVVTVLVSGCCSTCIWLLQYPLLVVTILISGCFSYFFRLLQYLPLVVMVLFSVFTRFLLLQYCTVTTRNEYCNKATTINVL
jgi:hypothetical protein